MLPRSCFKKMAVLWSLLVCVLPACSKGADREPVRPVAGPEALDRHCEQAVGKPRVERVSEHVWAALSFDLANTALIRTAAGDVVVDTSMSPAKARVVREALAAEIGSEPLAAIVYTHSHIDHIGGTSVWFTEGIPIWATEAFAAHFFKQYGLFRATESLRAQRQYGHHLPPETLPCCAIGPRMDIQAALENGMRLPTHTFSGRRRLEIGGLEIELVEAHGETHDQLFVWVPADRTLIAADNFYASFPNLYTIRGSSPRPVNDWIRSLDEMRRREPEHLLPMHTGPLHGKETIARALTNYRDAIQWVRDEVVRRGNRGEDVETMAASIRLPAHLAADPHLAEFYGQVDWSAKAIYDQFLGWFDGRPDQLYPPPAADTARREILLMGGPDKVLEEAGRALQGGDGRWAVHLLVKIQRSGLPAGEGEKFRQELARAYEQVAAGVANANGRAYLLESAIEQRQGKPFDPLTPKVSEEVAAGTPLETIFGILATRLRPEKAEEVHETVRFHFPDEGRSFVVTVRRGVAEIVEGEPLPGTPAPLAVFRSGAGTYRRIATGLLSPVAALASGEIKVEGDWLGFLKFMGRFERGI